MAHRLHCSVAGVDIWPNSNKETKVITFYMLQILSDLVVASADWHAIDGPKQINAAELWEQYLSAQLDESAKSRLWTAGEASAHEGNVRRMFDHIRGIEDRSMGNNN